MGIDASYAPPEAEDDDIVERVEEGHNDFFTQPDHPLHERSLRSEILDEALALPSAASLLAQDDQLVSSNTKEDAGDIARDPELIDQGMLAVDTDADSGDSTTPATSIDDLLLASSGNNTTEDHDSTADLETGHGQTKSR